MFNNKMFKDRFWRHHQIGRIISVTIVIICQTALPSQAQGIDEEKLWQQKSQLVIEHLANNYIVPQSGDLGKYVMPALIAYRWQYPNKNWQLQQREDLKSLLDKKPEDFYTNSDAFKAPGITRLLYLYPQDKLLDRVQTRYFQYLFPAVDRKHSFWSSGGTENFVNMLRTSGYLLAQKAVPLELPQANKKLAKKEQWLRNKAKKTYQVGVAEWDSSSYTIFNLIGWLNLYDFAEDPEMKAIAKAVLDYYASTIALKYTYGVYGGAEQRGGSATGSFNSYTDYLGWLWFSEYIPTKDSFFNWPQYIQLVHPATSSYRPPQEAISLARKQEPVSGLYRNAKSRYDLAKLEISEVFYIGKTYTLGTALIDVGEQVINWKLVSYPTENKSALVVTGSNSYLGKKRKNGMGKTIFDRYIQHQNILVQMSYVPRAVKGQLRKQQFRQFVVNAIDKIPCGNTCRHLLTSRVNKTITPITYPVIKKNNKYYVANYLSFPQNTEIIARQDTYFVKLDRTYLAISPFPPQPSLKPQSKGDRIYLESTAPLDTLTGFVVEVGNELEHQSFTDFQSKIRAKMSLDLKQLEWEKIRYKTIDDRQLFVDYAKSQLQANLKVNNERIKFLNSHLYKGNNLTLKNEILTIEDNNSIYQVDFQRQVPQFQTINK